MTSLVYFCCCLYWNLFTNDVIFHLLRNCSKLLTVVLGIVLPKEGFNTMVMSFVMMWVVRIISVYPVISWSLYTKSSLLIQIQLMILFWTNWKYVLYMTNKLQSNVKVFINPDSPFYLVQIRNVNTKRCLGELPSFMSPVLERISSCPNFKNVDSDSIVLDQLTVW